jgi:hypothetical protein
VEHVARVWQKIYACRIVVWRPERKRPLGKLVVCERLILKRILKKQIANVRVNRLEDGVVGNGQGIFRT